jgi:AraC-like DNA-binding protein
MEKRLLAQREAWVHQIAPTNLFHNLFDLIPGTYFFAKNRRGQIMFTCAASRRLYRINKETESIGITDFDINPPDMAESYVHDDARIYATGEPVLNRVELWFDEQGMPDWFVVNKIPIRSRGGKIVGIMGFSQSYEGRARLLAPFAGISKAVAHIRKNYQMEISIKELARASGLSQRQLERKFQAAFAVSPQDFLIKTRLLAASRLLRESDESLVQIAFDCGFTDQSAFSLHFRRHFGITPRDFRGQSHLGRPK